MGTFVGVAAAFVLVFLAPGILASRYLFPHLRISELIAVGFAIASALPPLVLWVASYAGVPLVRPVFALVLILFYAIPIFLLARRAAATPAFEQRLAAKRDFARAFLKNPWPHLLTRAMTRRALLVGVVVFGMWLVFVPKLDYRFPLHVDEWWSLGMAKGIVEQRTADIVDPFTGEWKFAYNPEVGFHLWLAYFQGLTGIEWFTIYRVFPMFLFAALLVSVYAFCEKSGFGVEAAFFTTLMPTTVRILGPSFLAPVTLGLVLIIASLVVAARTRGLYSYGLLGAIAVFSFQMHPPTTVAVAVAVGWYVIFGLFLKSERKRSAITIPLLAAPFLIGLPLILDKVSWDSLTEASTILVTPHLIILYGVVPVILFLIGTWLAFAPFHRDVATLALTALTFLLVLVAFDQWHFGQGNVFDRAFLYLTLGAYPVGGYAVHRLRTAFAPWVERTRARTAPERGPAMVVASFGIGAALLIGGMAAIELVPDRTENIDRRFYKLVDEDGNYQDWLWIRDNLGPEYEKAILGPDQFRVLMAKAFVVITGKHVYTINPFHPAVPATSSEDDQYFPRYFATLEFFSQRGANATFLSENGIQIVWGTQNIDNDNLTQIRDHPNIWRVTE